MSSQLVTNLTAQLPLKLSPKQLFMFEVRAKLIEFIVNSAIELNTSAIKHRYVLTTALYSTLKKMYPYAFSADIQQCCERVAGMFKSHATRIYRLSKSYEWHVKQGHTYKAAKIQKQLTKLAMSKPHVQENRIISLRKAQFKLHLDNSSLEISGFTAQIRQKVGIQLCEYTYSVLRKGICTSCELVKHKNGKWYAHFNIQVPVTSNESQVPVMGVDLGITNLAALSTGQYVPGETTWQHCEKLSKHRSALQAQGTRSAKRRLKSTSGRYRRYVNDRMHCVSKWVVQQAQAQGAKTIALESLHLLPPNLISNPHLRKAIGRWPYALLRSYIIYKAQLAGIAIVPVNPAYTSTTCMMCGHQDKKNRIDQATFHCQKCGYTTHADIHAAINIANKASAEIISRAAANQPIVALF